MGLRVITCGLEDTLRTRILCVWRVCDVRVVVHNAGVSVVVDAVTCDFVDLHLTEFLFILKTTLLLHFNCTEFGIVLLLGLAFERIFLG